MARDFFEQYPKTSVKRAKNSVRLSNGDQAFFDVPIVDISVRYTIKEQSENIKQSLFYKYVWKERDRPDLFADRYYGSVKFHWMIFMANNNFAFPSGYASNSYNLDRFLLAKYKDFAVTEGIIRGFLVDRTDQEFDQADVGKYIISGADFYDWTDGTAIEPSLITQDQYTFSFLNTQVRQYIVEGFTVDKEEYDAEVALGNEDVRILTFYSYEIESNEDKRIIQVVDNDLQSKVFNEFSDKMAKLGARR